LSGSGSLTITEEFEWVENGRIEGAALLSEGSAALVPDALSLVNTGVTLRGPSLVITDGVNGDVLDLSDGGTLGVEGTLDIEAASGPFEVRSGDAQGFVFVEGGGLWRLVEGEAVVGSNFDTSGGEVEVAAGRLSFTY